MSVNDWFVSQKKGKKKFWRLGVHNDQLTSVMNPGQGPNANRFTLKPSRKDGEIVYFTVEFTGNALPPVWKNLRLFPRGDTAVPLPLPQPTAAPPPPLPPEPRANEQTDLLKAAQAVGAYLGTHGISTERLDGQIKRNGKVAGLTLVQVANAIPMATAPNGAEALLCMYLYSDVPLGTQSNPDGTGGGSSGHH